MRKSWWSFAAILCAVAVAVPAAALDAGKQKIKPSEAAGRLVPSAASCALLDDPRKAGRMDGLLTWLAKGCGREAEFIGGVHQAPDEAGAPNLTPQAVDVAVNDATLDQGVSKTQSETSLALNETTGTICASWNDADDGITESAGFTGFARSINNGATFVDQGPVSDDPNADSGDPSLVWRKTDGKFYYAALLNGGLGVYRSDDDCDSFVFVGMISSTGNDDKEIMTVDNNVASPGYGNLYVAWTDFTDGRITVRTSTTAGASWAAPVKVSVAAADVQGAWPTVAPNGDVYVGWVRWNPSFPASPLDIEVVRSTNQGGVFSSVANPMTGGGNPRDSAATGNCGRPALNGNVRYLPNPTLAVDGSGNVHVVYSKDPDAFNSGDVVNIYYRRSLNSGTSWEPEIQINDDGTTTDQWQPSLSVGAGNVVAIGYYSRQNDVAGNLLLDYYQRSSYDGGATWIASTRLSDVSTPIVLDSQLATCYHGDYDTNIHRPGAAQYLWSDDRAAGGFPTNPNIYSESTPAGVDFLVVPNPSSRTVCAPTSAVYPSEVFSFQGFVEPVTLSASGEPAGTTVGFSTNPVTPPGSSTVTITTAGVAAFVTATVTVTGTASPSGIIHTAPLELNVYTVVPTAATLVSPADGTLDTPRRPVLTWTPGTGQQEFEVEVATDAAFTAIVASATVTGSSWQVDPPLAITTQHFWRVRPSNICGDGPNSAVFDFTTATPTVLLVDDDNNAPDVQATYSAALGTRAVFDLWDVATEGGEPTLADLTPYELVVWFSGVAFGGDVSPVAGPQAAAETALGQYLALGEYRCVWISSQDYLWDMGGPGHNVPTAFMQNYLGVNAAGASSDNGDYTSVTGQNHFVGLTALPLTYPFTDYSDRVAPSATGQIAWVGNNGFTGAVSKNHPEALGIYMTFPWEAFSLTAQGNVMDRVFRQCQPLLLVADFEENDLLEWSSTVP